LQRNSNGSSRKVERKNLARVLALGGHLRRAFLAKAHSVAVAAAIEDEPAIASRNLIRIAAQAIPTQRAANPEAQRACCNARCDTLRSLTCASTIFAGTCQPSACAISTNLASGTSACHAAVLRRVQ